MATTKLDKIKEVALQFLYAPMPNDIIVSHPFTTSTVTLVDGKQLNLLDMNDLAIWQAYMTKFIRESESFKPIYYMIQKPYKLGFLKLIRAYISLEEYSEFFRDAYISDEFPCRNNSKRDLLVQFRKLDKKSLMREEDYEVYCNLPQVVTAYRWILNQKYKKGLSWSLDVNIAQWFGKRFADGNNYLLCKVNAPKDRIYAYFNDRNEKEVIIDTTNLDIEYITN